MDCSTSLKKANSSMGLYRLGITNIQLLEDLSLSLLYQMFCNFFLKKLQIFRPTSRACETIGLVGTAPKTSLFSSKFHDLSNGNNETSWKCLVPEIELGNGNTIHLHWGVKVLIKSIYVRLCKSTRLNAYIMF